MLAIENSRHALPMMGFDHIAEMAAIFFEVPIAIRQPSRPGSDLVQVAVRRVQDYSLIAPPSAPPVTR